MADDEDEDKTEGEPLFEYIKRLEILAGTARVRVPKRWLDKRGNLFLPPQAIYLVDETGIPHETADTAGRLPVSTGIGEGGIRLATGTFTKNATGTVGTVIVSPGVDDVIYFMYGIITIGAAHAGAASPLHAGIASGNAHTDIRQKHLYDATADADDPFLIPGLGEVVAAGATDMVGPMHPYQAMIAGSNRTTQDGPGALGGSARYVIAYETMADTETFLYILYFYSETDTAITTAATLGAVA